MSNWLITVLDVSLDRLLLIVSVALIVLSFDPIRYREAQFDFCLQTDPNVYLLIPGGLLLVLFLWRQREHQPQNACADKIQDGYKLTFDSNHAISVVTGCVENFSGGDHAVVVLPANTSFDDQCIHDKRSALGSFFLTHFPSGIDVIQELIRREAARECGETEEYFRTAPAGTTIILDKPLGSCFRIMITAVTSFDAEQGITADTLSLISSVKQVFRRASQNRISSITMPVLGTGHGGLDFKAALSLLLVQCMYSMQYEGFHHVREVKIVVYDPDNRTRDTVSRIVHAFGNMTQI
ncbi:MAG: macro domain-containing protein [bacterium]